MLDLTFGEQVKIVLSRKGMTIKELAEIIEERTGKKMSRQNLTQRLGRDNFQEQDMRVIADILGCPFQLSILADINEVERASRIEDVKPTEKELSKLARAKERREDRKENKEKYVEAKAEKKEEAPAPAQKPEVQPRMQRYIVAGRAREESKVIEREMPEFKPSVKKRVEAPVYEAPVEEPVYEASVEEPVYEAPVEESVYEASVEEAVEEYVEEPVYEEAVEEYVEEYVEEPAQEAPAEETAEELIYGGEFASETENTMQVEDSELAELLNEIDGIEKGSQKEEVKETVPQEDKKNRGWRSVFQRRSKKEEPAAKKEAQAAEEYTEAPAQEAEHSEEYLDEGAQETAHYESDYIDYESTEVPEEEVEEPEEEPVVGDINPYTGEEYESNSVRMHPKRIGYVQVYDRSDHQWTDMTEWAFLGYQERKKALLGRDYEEPIYLD